MQQDAKYPQNRYKTRIDIKMREGTKPKLPQKEENMKLGEPISFLT